MYVVKAYSALTVICDVISR